VAEKSAIQRIKDLDAERASIFDHAKAEALEKAKAAVAELNGLGLNTRCPMPAESKPRLGLAKAKALSRRPLARFASFRRHAARRQDSPEPKEEEPIFRRRVEGKRVGEGVSGKDLMLQRAWPLSLIARERACLAELAALLM
jgi:hypothetical protein